MTFRLAVLAAAMTIASSCTPAEPARSAAQDPERPTTEVSKAVSPLAAAGTHRVDQGRFVTGVGEARVEVGYQWTLGAGPALVVFPAIESPNPDCVVRADLRITIAEGAPDRRVAVYPVKPEEVRGVSEGDRISSNWLLDKRPRGVVRFAGNTGEADITELVKTWTTGRPFPLSGLQVPPGEPIALSIQPETARNGDTFLLFVADQDNNRGPQLTLATRC